VKRIISIILLLLILSSILLTLSYITQITVRGAEHVFFEDNFESYDVGTFPSGGGWKLWYSGMGSKHQMIVDNFSNSTMNSLQLLGDQSSNWAAYAAKSIDTDSPIIGFSVRVRVESLGGGDVRPRSDVARVGFAALVPPVYARSYAPILFKDYGTITTMGEDLQSYFSDRWYKVTLIIDRNVETYSVWIDDVLVGENLPVMTNKGPLKAGETSWDIGAFAVSQNYYSTRAYFDDVSIFSVFDVDPKLELVPATGIAATTLVGSGFAPNSEISVTWDDTPLPTVPSPLFTDDYGNFTGIISVLSQTEGEYTVRAIDEIGTEANATFTVYSDTSLDSPSSPSASIEEQFEEQNQYEEFPEFPSWVSLLIPLLVVMVIGVIYKQKLCPRNNGKGLM
jgi:hypothetical protein